MARPSKPFWKASHKAWYCTIAGARHRLGTDEKEAQREFHRLMAIAGNSPAPRSLSVAQLADLFLEDVRDRVRPATWENYQTWLERWCRHVGSLRGCDIRPLHVSGWFRSHPTWGANTRSMATTIVKLWSRWCRRQGYLTADPLQDLRNTSITRRSRPEPGAIEAVISTVSTQLRDFLVIALATGCRPGELRMLEASQIDFKTRVAKVIGKTGKRDVALPSAILPLLRQLCERWPDGPILRNTLGKPWTRGAIVQAMVRARQRTGAKHVVAYSTRGEFGTEALRCGVDLLLVSKLLGHSTPAITAKHYLEPDQQMLADAVEKATRKRRA